MQEKQEKSKKKKIKKFKYWMQTSLVVVFGFVVAFFLVLMIRLAFLSGEDKYEKSALAQQSYVSSVIPYKRGSILDRNGNVLAASDLIYHLILDPKVLLSKEENVAPTIEALVQVYGFNETELRSILVEKAESSYVVLRRQMSYADKELMTKYEEEWAKKKEQDKELKGDIKGVWFEEEYKRSYPYQSVASHIIGFTGADNQGLLGIEQIYDSKLKGQYGRIVTARNADGTEMPYKYDRYYTPEDGSDITLTIDVSIQHFLEKHLDQAVTDLQLKQGAAGIIMDVKTGEILAMATKPDFDLNAPFEITDTSVQKTISSMEDDEEKNDATNEYLNKLWRNKAVVDSYEPVPPSKSSLPLWRWNPTWYPFRIPLIAREVTKWQEKPSVAGNTPDTAFWI